MNYKFPTIKTIDDVLPAVEGREEFVVAEREFGTVINYNVNMPDTFDIDENDLMLNYDCEIPKGIMRRECRGIIFDREGFIMSRPFHKFFNVGERDETQSSVLDMSKKHTIMEKMDGSMIRPIALNGRIRLATKMGITDVSLQAEEWIEAHSEKEVLKDYLRVHLLNGITPLFEFIAPDNRIVINYNKADLVLLAKRYNHSGLYDSYSEVFDDRQYWTVVKDYGEINGNLDEYISRQRETEGREGDVIRFANGQMLKIKNDWYVRIHKAMDRVRFDRNIVDLIVNEELDDVLPMMPDYERERISEFEEEFWKAFQKTETRLEQLCKDASRFETKKEVALEFIPTLSNKQDASFVFRMLDGRNIRELLLEHVQKSIGNNTKWEACAEWMGMDGNNEQ